MAGSVVVLSSDSSTEEDEPAPTLELQLESLRARVSELGDNPANLVAIADWCAATYVQPGEDRAATVERVQEYLKDALLTVTQQVASSGSALSAFLEQQSLEHSSEFRLQLKLFRP